jgi:MFS family permease
VEYLANDRYGIDADAGKVALLTVTVPAIARLLVSPVFGWMFDVLSFFALRIALNILFALGIVAFFTGRSDLGLVAGAVVFGVAAGGGDLMWQLWATKFAPPERVADYMGLHTFSTGLRGLLAPFVAFRVVQSFSVAAVGVLAAALIILGSVVLVPDARQDRARRRAAPAVT